MKIYDMSTFIQKNVSATFIMQISIYVHETQFHFNIFNIIILQLAIMHR